MCGRYVMSLSLVQLEALFGKLDRLNYPPSWNAAPTQALPIIRLGRQADFRLTAVRWGLVPHWSRTGPDGSKPLINARSETAADKPSFRQALQRRRALVPADGFYEWSTEESGRKQPWYINRTDGQPMVMAGVWERWGEGADRVDSFAILTTAASADIAHIHHRSPVFIPEGRFADWLNPETDPQPFLKAPPEGALTLRKASDRVNAVRENDSRLIVSDEG
ncbi:SOS response-associated peptidase [Oceanicaulis alexandrii]|uniref:SOS response-associated peptidase n=1 Tax=Oceanicaulis alexandrii TaxID=153233 RepID=UPI002357A55A|nr:SOS response-associated peptidase [Oceanicaulis alexandrii]